MKKLFFIIILFYQFKSTAQSPYILENIFGLNLKFKMSEDSVQNMYRIKFGELLDSSTANINGISWNIDRYIYCGLGCRYRKKISSFLHAKSFPDSLFSVLDFYSGKLIQVAIYYKGDKRTNDVKNEIMRYFKLKEFSCRVSDKTIMTSLQRNKDGYNCLVISDKKAVDLVPPWCGNSRRRGSWTKLQKYVSQTK